MRCSLKPGFTSLPSPSSHTPLLPCLVLLPLSIYDTCFHAHPREATLATTRSLEERRGTVVRLLIYICGALHIPVFSNIPLPPAPYFIFSDNMQFKRNGTWANRMNVHGYVMVDGCGGGEGGLNWCHYVLSGSLGRKLYQKRRSAKNMSKHCDLIKRSLTVMWKREFVRVCYHNHFSSHQVLKIKMWAHPYTHSIFSSQTTLAPQSDEQVSWEGRSVSRCSRSKGRPYKNP